MELSALSAFLKRRFCLFSDQLEKIIIDYQNNPYQQTIYLAYYRSKFHYDSLVHNPMKEPEKMEIRAESSENKIKRQLKKRKHKELEEVDKTQKFKKEIKNKFQKG